MGLRVENLDTNLKESQLFWYRLITLIWAPIQFLTLFGILTLTMYTEMALAEKIGLFCAMGVLTGTIGINYAHELMHKTGKIERWLADALLAMVLYSHFRSEHLLVHHIHVGTPRDPVTAKYNENFYKFFIRVLIQCPISSFKSESIKLGRKGLPPSDFSNPFYIYIILQIFMIALSFLIGGFLGLLLFFFKLSLLFYYWNLSIILSIMVYRVKFLKMVNMSLFNLTILGTQHIRCQIGF